VVEERLRALTADERALLESALPALDKLIDRETQ
jgi:hypothetical protein